MISPGERAEMIAAIRALADLLESQPGLEMPYRMHTSAYPGTIEGVFDCADILGVPVERVYGGYPRVAATFSLHPYVSYQAYESLNVAATATDDRVVVTREQMLGPSPAEATDSPVGSVAA